MAVGVVGTSSSVVPTVLVVLRSFLLYGRVKV